MYNQIKLHNFEGSHVKNNDKPQLAKADVQVGRCLATIGHSTCAQENLRYQNECPLSSRFILGTKLEKVVDWLGAWDLTLYIIESGMG